MAKPLVITVMELKEYLKISLPTAYAMTELPGFHVLRVGRKKLIPIADLERWLTHESSRGNEQKALKRG